MRDKGAHDALELAGRHLGQTAVVDDGAAARGLAADDVAAGRLGARVAVEAVGKVGAGPGPKGGENAAGGGRGPRREGGDEMRADIVFGVPVGGEELLEDLERVGTVASAADGEARRAQLGVLLGIMGDAKRMLRGGGRRAEGQVWVLPEDGVDIAGSHEHHVLHAERAGGREASGGGSA